MTNRRRRRPNRRQAKPTSIHRKKLYAVCYYPLGAILFGGFATLMALDLADTNLSESRQNSRVITYYLVCSYFLVQTVRSNHALAVHPQGVHASALKAFKSDSKMLVLVPIALILCVAGVLAIDYFASG